MDITAEQQQVYPFELPHHAPGSLACRLLGWLPPIAAGDAGDAHEKAGKERRDIRGGDGRVEPGTTDPMDFIQSSTRAFQLIRHMTCLLKLSPRGYLPEGCDPFRWRDD